MNSQVKARRPVQVGDRIVLRFDDGDGMVSRTGDPAIYQHPVTVLSIGSNRLLAPADGISSCLFPFLRTARTGPEAIVLLSLPMPFSLGRGVMPPRDGPWWSGKVSEEKVCLQAVTGRMLELPLDTSKYLPVHICRCWEMDSGDCYGQSWICKGHAWFAG